MAPCEQVAFEAQPDWRDALRLRRWDDLAKDPAAKVPGLGAYHEDLCGAAAAAARADASSIGVARPSGSINR